MLRASKYPHGSKRWKLLDIIDGVKYTVFEVMFPTDEKQPEIIDMSELETEESAEQKVQQGKRVKILTTEQMLNTLPISLAQLKQEIIHKTQ